MLRLLIGGLVGGLILFIWQFMSWTFLEIHAVENTYTPNQQKVIDCLSANLEEGEFMIPGIPPGTSAEKREELGLQMAGKPWAKIKYGSSFEVNMGMNMLRGFVVNFLSVFLLCWLLVKISNPAFTDILFGSMIAGFIAYLNMSYIESVWFETSSVGDLIDALVSWGFVGGFLGWWLRR